MNKIKNFAYLILIILFVYIIRVSTTEQKAIFAVYTKNHKMVKDSVRYIDLKEELKNKCKSFKYECRMHFLRLCEIEMTKSKRQYPNINTYLRTDNSPPSYSNYNYYAKCEIQGF